ncbi:ribonuclease Z, mitochondrial [Teleopsis dalmanni]|uniref:ribonuclease Z, mitochondrial n=1 Tax=Teleopsis dalmanni TaxID=139649 RepID=UPI0018CD7CC7|nr:ribonuclease Z, mitochondrial [Teleopsis dalmanni]
MLLSNLKRSVCNINTNCLNKQLNKLQLYGKLEKHNCSSKMTELRQDEIKLKLLETLSKPNNFQMKQKVKLRHEKQQQAAKKKSAPYIPGTVNLQILGAGAGGAPSAIYLFTDQSRYLFNCGEGTQRLAHEHKTKLSRLEQIFVTRNTWSMIGGFPGLVLTVQDTGVKELSLHGPPNLDKILHSMKRFVVLKTLQVKTLDCTENHDFEDSVMSVKCVPLYRSNSEVMINTPNDNVVIAYICKLKPRPGALNLEKCVEYGVPPGPLLGLLKNGQDVVLDNGQTVKSSDVSEPNESTAYFIFLDIPTIEFLPSLQKQEKLFHELSDEIDSEIPLVVHFSPDNILENNSFQTFINKFPTNTQHIYLNSSKNSFSGYVAAHRIQYQLNQLNPKIFPILGEVTCDYNNLNISNKLRKTKLIESVEPNMNIDNCEEDVSRFPVINSLSNFHLRPQKGLDHAMSAKLNPNEYITETQKLEEFPLLLKKLKEEYSNITLAEEYSYPKVVFLGTGSCIPNKTRNVSAILIQTSQNSYALLDCGEGTLGQIKRFYGKTKAEEVIRNLNVIYVSHLHADHHIGLIGLLNERQRLLNDNSQKVLLLAPKQIEPWLNFYNESIESITNTYELIGNGEILSDPLHLLDAKTDTGISTIATCLVRHCPHSFGVSLTLTAQYENKPIKITYSGDSMPCQDLVELGRNSTILIHEATMEDDLIEEAKIKMHSTISQAIDQGRAMDAEHIILTHFSQRYAKLPRMQNVGEETETETMRNVAIAFDNMQVTLDDLKHFHLMYPALKALFVEHAEELEQKAVKRELKLERKRKLLNAEL